MSAEVQNSKATLRVAMRAQLKKMSSEERMLASGRVCSTLKEQETWKGARSILFYAPLAEEPDIWPLLGDALAAGKTVALPRFMPDRSHYAACQIESLPAGLRPGQFGIREPDSTCATIPLNELDFILVPGVAFDLDGHRLGRGKGFYDRLLAVVRGATCGVAFDQQIVSAIPLEPHDIRLSCILTPTRWRCFARPRAVLE